MADFSRWGYAIGEALGAGLGQQFIDEYTVNSRIQNEEAIANDTVGMLISEFMRKQDTWHGLYSQLYKQLAFIAEDYGINAKHKSFPATTILLSKRITNVKSNLEAMGINVVRDESRSKEGQGLSITRVNLSTPSTPTTQFADYAGLRGVDGCADELHRSASAHATTPEEPLNLATCADGVEGVEENRSSAGDWCNVGKNVPGAELPEEFL